MKQKQRIIIYSSVPRLFRTTYISYLYDIAQKYSVIFLSEKLDSESEKAIRNSSLFPYLEKIIPIDQYTGKKRTLFESHKHFSSLVRKIVFSYKPRVVIADSMINSLEKYLFRYGRLVGAVNVVFQAGFQPPSIEQEMLRQFLLWRDTGNNTKYGIKIREIKIEIVKLKQHVIELLDYWVFPLMMGTYPFFHKSLFRYGVGPEVKDIDYIVVFSTNEANLERKIGRPEKAIKILPHPLRRKTKEIFGKVYQSFCSKKHKMRGNKTLTVMIDVNTFGHRRDDLSLIPEEEYLRSRLSVIDLIAKILPKWKIFIKPHPMWTNDIGSLEKYYKKTPSGVKIVESAEPADKYIEISSVIIGFPPPSTTLFTTMLQDSDQLVVYVDLHHELLGDAFAGYEEIKYIDSLGKLRTLLENIRDDSYHYKKKVLPKADYLDSAADILEEII